MEEVPETDEVQYDDEDEDDEEDRVETRQDDSESEQDLDSEPEPDTHFSEIESRTLSDEETEAGSAARLCFVAKDGVTSWKKHEYSLTNVRTRSKNIITDQPGVKRIMQNKIDVLDIWASFFDSSIMDLLVNCTNKSIGSVHENYERPRNAVPTNIQELKALFGLLYLAAVRKVNHVNTEDLWKTNGTSIEMFRLTMSQYRFKFLLRHLRFDDKETRNDRVTVDKLAPIRQLYDMFLQNCQSNYSVSEHTTVDEMLVAFRGRCSFRQYIPSKPSKYGIKIFALVDAHTFYAYNLEVYVGKQPPGPYSVDNSGKEVVKRLCTAIAGSGRNVTTDNWFTSKPLADELLRNYKLTLVGTIKKNKKELPREFTEGKARPISSSMFGYQKDCLLVSHIPKKNKNVLLISTMHDSGTVDSDSGKPEVIMFYNKTKGGVDTVDKLCASYNCARYTRRWPVVIFYNMMNLAGINSFIIHTANNPASQMNRRTFLERLAFSLIEPQLKYRVTINTLPKTIRLRLSEICHINIPTENMVTDNTVTSGRCKMCDWKKNRKTKYKCRKCEVFLCLEHVIPTCSHCYNCTNDEEEC